MLLYYSSLSLNGSSPPITISKPISMSNHVVSRDDNPELEIIKQVSFWHVRYRTGEVRSVCLVAKHETERVRHDIHRRCRQGWGQVAGIPKR